MFARNLIAAAAIAALFGAAPRTAPAEWHITPILTEGAVTRLDMTLTFPGDPDGETLLDLPDDWGGERELYRALWDITVEGAATVPAEDPSQMVLRHAPGAPITLHWKLGAGPDTPPAKLDGNDYRPRFTPDYFFVIGYAALPWPEHLHNESPARITLDRPEGLTLVSDLDHAGKNGETTFGDLAQSTLFGGNIRLVESGSARLALVGTFDIIEDSFWQETFTRVATAERAYWKSKAEPFLVTVISEPADPEHYSYGGTGLGDAFSIFAGSNMQPEDVAPLIAHEMMHSWIPHRIGRMPEDNEATHYWLSEGFTEWTIFRLLVREGLWAPQDFADAFNTATEAFDLSALRGATADEIAAKFWLDGDMGRLPYRKGMLIASWLDAKVREKTKGKRNLDDVLLKMQKAAKRDSEAQAYDLLLQSLKRVARWDAAAELEAMAMQGGPVPLPADIFAPCGQLVTSQRQTWERGFDFSATAAANWKIQGVVEGSNAYAAGLRDGMELRSWSESSDDRDPATEKTALVTEGEGVRAITWLPAGKERLNVRTFDLAEGLTPAAEAACRKRLGGF